MDPRMQMATELFRTVMTVQEIGKLSVKSADPKAITQAVFEVFDLCLAKVDEVTGKK
ncbi:MAG: hypothetical protein JWM80_1263 [Cyanobacteria bacterium RYN_339]|nr:hypothetical protein [Cyanobacteria bacterium RYN_339]